MATIMFFVFVAVIVSIVIYGTYTVLQRQENELLRFAEVSKTRPWVTQLATLLTQNRMMVFVSIGAVGLLVLGQYLIALILVLFVFARRQYVEGEKRKEIIENLPASIAIMVRSLRAGQTIENSTRSVVDFTASEETRNLFKRILQMLYISGKPLSDILYETAKKNRLNELAMLASILDTHAHVGGNVTEVLTIFEEQMRRSMVTQKKIVSLMTEGRTSVIILAIIPLLVLGAIMNTAPDYLQFFLSEEGHFSLFLVIAFYISGIIFSIAFVRGR